MSVTGMASSQGINFLNFDGMSHGWVDFLHFSFSILSTICVSSTWSTSGAGRYAGNSAVLRGKYS